LIDLYLLDLIFHVLNLATGLKALYDITGLEEDEQLTDKDITKIEIAKIQQILRKKKKKN
jgi:hypothetical protein